MTDPNTAVLNIRNAFRNFLDQLETLPEASRPEAFEPAALDRLARLFAPPKSLPETSAYEYLLAHKAGLTAIARLRHLMAQRFSLRGHLDTGQDVYVSPSPQQWFDDGVVLLQGTEPFAGAIGLYRSGRLSFAVAARDAKNDALLGPEDFLFVDVEVAVQQQEALRASSEADTAVATLERLLACKENRESDYQRFFTRHPWVLGALHTSVQSHVPLDDRNIPDFSAVRARDGARDVLEIKPPFLQLFRSDDDFSADFNSAWNQAERYLDFTRREADYLLRQKGLRFETPHCYLIAGFGLSDVQRARIQAKERLNPSVTFLTYEEVQTLLRNTLTLVRQLSPTLPLAEHT
ncbi:MAG: DUF4263 domain-containing protein [Holophagales bacterium]|nr:DUF4263 domain-containing protein [Holophagales bacterium]